jgi:hypothetical protein
MLGPVDLVHAEQDRLGRPVKNPREHLVLGEQPGLAVDHEEDGVCVLDGGARVGLYGAGKPGVGHGVEAGRVDQQDPALADLDLFGDAVARDAGLVLHQRPPVARVAIEQRRFAHVGATDDRHDRELRGGRHTFGGVREDPGRLSRGAGGANSPALPRAALTIEAARP